MMSNLFLTYSFGNFDELTSVLNSSINEFSKFPIKIYKYPLPSGNYDGVKKFIEFCKIKILCCIDAIENNLSDNFVWIDGDSIAHKNIDKIWFEVKRVDNYPLLGKYKFKNFTFFNDDEFPYKLLCNKLNINYEKYIYRQANFMLFNKDCLPFFKEVINIMESNFDENLIPLGDESVINALFCKYNYFNNLGNINLCSESFTPDNGIINFIRMKNREDYFNIYTIYENNYEDILVFHGNKDINVANEILEELISIWK